MTDEKELHETFMLDLTYRIAEARKNAAMHNATAATLDSLKDLFERRIEEHRRRTSKPHAEPK